MEKDRLNIYLSAEVIKAAKIQAIERDTSLSKIVEQVLRNWLSLPPSAVEVEAKS